jgi:hypothetical protein
MNIMGVVRASPVRRPVVVSSSSGRPSSAPPRARNSAITFRLCAFMSSGMVMTSPCHEHVWPGFLERV